MELRQLERGCGLVCWRVAGGIETGAGTPSWQDLAGRLQLQAWNKWLASFPGHGVWKRGMQQKLWQGVAAAC